MVDACPYMPETAWSSTWYVPFCAPHRHLCSQVANNPHQASGRADTTFDSPESVNPSRPLGSYLHPGLGQHSLFGHEVFQIALTEMFRAVFRKRNLRRTPGPQGELSRIQTDGSSGFQYLTEDWSGLSPLPTSMRVCWDE